MGDQAYAGPGVPYWLGNFGVDRVYFNKLEAPPLSELDKNIVYTLDNEDGATLYLNGTPVGGGAGGDVSSSTDPSVDNALCRFDSTTGKLIQQGNLILEDGSADMVQIKGLLAGTSYPLLMCTDSTQKTALGFHTPIDSSLGISSTAIGHGAMQLTSGAQNCVAIGADALYNCNGNNNVCIGTASGLQLTGVNSRNICIDSPGVSGDNDTIRIGNPLFHTDCFIQGIRGSTPALVSPEMVIVDSTGKLSSAAIPTGSGGDVVGPASSTTNAVALYNGSTGKLIKDSSLLYSLNTNAPRLEINGWENLLFTQANHSQFMGYKSGNTFADSQQGVRNTAFGGGSMQSHTGGDDSVAIGTFALANKTNQGNCTAVGSNALAALNSGSGGNTAFGTNALLNLTSGFGNICIGSAAGVNYTTTESSNILIGANGVAAENNSIRIGTNTQDKCFIAREFKSNQGTLRVGWQAGNTIADTNTTSRNTLIGMQTGVNLSAQTDITHVGYFAGRYCTGSSNTTFGCQALSGINATGANMVVIGFNAANITTSAANSTIIGTAATPALTSGSTNVCIGNGCAQQLTTGSNNILIAGGGANCATLATGSSNIIIGANAPAAASATSIIIGSATQTATTIAEDFRSSNTTTRVGYRAANALTSGTNTVAVGSLSLAAITSQGSNTACGYAAGQGTTGQFNAIFGTSSMNSSGTSFNNSVFGASAAQAITSGGNNSCFGLSTLPAGTTCSNIIAIGANAGGVQATGSNCIYIAANASTAAESNTIRIGTAVANTRAFIAGVSGVTTGGAAVACLVDANGQLGTVSSSRTVKEQIRPIESTDWIHSLELVNFEYINGSVDPITGLKQKQAGVIAEDCEVLKSELVIVQGSGVKTVDYQYILISALKELQKVRADHDALAARVAALESPQ